MKSNRLSPEYEKGVVEFLEFAERKLHKNNVIFIILMFYAGIRKS